MSLPIIRAEKINGEIRCACGHKLGNIRPNGLEHKCGGCRQIVEIPLPLYKLNLLEQAMQAQRELVAAIGAIV